MPRVFAVGETVYDIIFRNYNPVAARVGGSMLNSAVSLGRLGIETFLISEYGDDNDPVALIINEFLLKNGVNTDLVNRSEDNKSDISLAFLDDRNDANYSFYKCSSKNKFNLPDFSFKANDILLFGSFFSLNPEIRPMLLNLLNKAKESEAIIIYDPNFRRPHLNELKELKPFIIENLGFPDIIRGSDEDFSLIFNSNSVEDAFKVISNKNDSLLVYTQNRKGVDLFSANLRMHLGVPAIQPVSTIGAGDSFNAGLIWSLLKEGISKKDIQKISDNQWGNILRTGIRFATDVCLSYENYISGEFVAEMSRKYP